MPQKRTWAAPPTRRELTLALFALTVFVLSYNLEASLGLVGVRPQKLSSSYLLSIGELSFFEFFTWVGSVGDSAWTLWLERRSALHG